MSPIYESQEYSRDELFELRKRNRCKQCGGMLNVFLDIDTHSAYLACNSDQSHEGIEREAPTPFEPNIPTRREDMIEEHGKEVALALRRFDAVATLDRKSATDILKIMWPAAEKASPAEFAIALGLCVDYGLDPRLREVFLIPFKHKVKDDKGKVTGEETRYETVRGIRATRKVALRKHKYTYLDDTPRYMTEAEEIKVYKVVDPDKIRYITKLKDVETGAEFPGYGQWPKYRTWVNPKTSEIKKYSNEPKGVDKGNSMENMAAIHSERAALERGYPADMPSSRIPVVDEAFVEGKYEPIVDEAEGVAEEEGFEPSEPVSELTKTHSSKTEGGGESDVRPDAAGAAVEGESAADSPPTKDKTQKPAGAPPTKPQRNPATIKNFGDLYTACKEDWPDEFNTRQAVWKELGVSSQEQLTEIPAELYKKIAAIRK